MSLRWIKLAKYAFDLNAKLIGCDIALACENAFKSRFSQTFRISRLLRCHRSLSNVNRLVLIKSQFSPQKHESIFSKTVLKTITIAFSTNTPKPTSPNIG
jgi:hypothetical protein